MFKSLVTKYIAAFLLIIMVSFTALAILLSVMVRQEQTRELGRNVYNFVNYTQTRLSAVLHTREDFTTFSLDVDQVYSIISAISEYNEINIFIVDYSGNIMLSAGSVLYHNVLINSEIISQISETSEYYHSGNFGGVFSYPHIVHALRLDDEHGEFVGTVIAAADLTTINAVVDGMLRTIIVACVFVMIVGFAACAFISEKISTPLLDMRKAAKSFANGDFNTRVNAKGKDEIAELATAFNNMAQSLSELEELRRSFVANVSHDLRTPMTSIAGFIDGILDGIIPTEKHPYYLGIVGSEVKRLSRLVTTLLDVSRLQSGDRKFNMARFDVCEVARQVLISFEEKITERKLDITFESEREKMIIAADSDAIHQVFYNLIENAIKFSWESAKLRIKISSQNDEIRISIFNQGIGVAPEDLGQVFDRFYKADKSRGLDKSGTGLGLFICKAIIDAHGGAITLNSQQDKWCEFVIILPKNTESSRKSTRILRK